MQLWGGCCELLLAHFQNIWCTLPGCSSLRNSAMKGWLKKKAAGAHCREPSHSLLTSRKQQLLLLLPLHQVPVWKEKSGWVQRFKKKNASQKSEVMRPAPSDQLFEIMSQDYKHFLFEQFLFCEITPGPGLIVNHCWFIVFHLCVSKSSRNILTKHKLYNQNCQCSFSAFILANSNF